MRTRRRGSSVWRRAAWIGFAACICAGSGPARAKPVSAPAQSPAEASEQDESARLNAEIAGHFLAGRYAEAESLARRALEIHERALGRDHPDTLRSVGRLAEIYQYQGRYAEAEPLFRRALEGRERVLGPDHRDTLSSVESLTRLYQNQGRHAEAEPLARRALEGFERVLGGDHPHTLLSVNTLAGLYLHLGRHAEAEPLLRRALEGRERMLGRDHADTLGSVNNLALLYRAQGLHAVSEPLFRRALEGFERVLGGDHPQTLQSVNNLAASYRAQGRQAEAEPLYRRALEGRERVLGRDHPDTLRSAEALTIVRLERSPATAAALPPARLLLDGVRKRRVSGGADQQARTQREREALSAAGRFALFADAAWVAGSDAAARQAGLSEAFAALQDSIAGAADRSVAAQAARRYVAGRDAALGELMRERQRLEDEWTRLDADLAAAFAAGPEGPGERPAAVRARLEAVQARLAAVDARLRDEAPEYFALVEPTPLDVTAAQRLLGPDEAVLLAVPSRFGTHVVAVTRESAQWRRSDWNAERVRAAVQRLRWDLGATVDASPEELAALRARSQGGRPGFDRASAHDLYRQLVAPVAGILSGKRRLYVAAGGALAAIPFHVLVSAPPAGADNDPAALRATRWFGDDFALLHVPSIQALALLRQSERTGGGDGFVGIGDPVLDGQGQSRSRGAAIGLPAARDLFRAGRSRDGSLFADTGQLRRLARLPGTARELEAVRRTLEAPPASLLLAERATETNVRAADLSRTRIILLSTHGLTAAESASVGVGEAGLVLTPPATARDGDDGFLAASEVTTLRLNSADWVILSACNTATGDGTDSAGLGRLARAFFYAGARNLLASHWPVSDDVAPILITQTLALERAGASRAEAFQQAMRQIRLDETHDSPADSWAHPFYWAPFVLIGDGGN